MPGTSGWDLAKFSRLIFLALLALGNGLLLAPAGSLPRLVGALALLMLPGLAWAKRLFPTLDHLTRWTVGVALSYTLAMVLGLTLHYLPGPVPLWAELAAINALAIVPWLGKRGWNDLSLHRPAPSCTCPAESAGRTAPAGAGQHGRAQPMLETLHRTLGAFRWLLVLLLVVAAFFRCANLGYSEFQGDEALAMISAAEALEGHQDALFLRGKGPGEVLLPMVLWRLTGAINEAAVRVPFTTAGVLMVLTTFLLGRRLFHGTGRPLGERAGLIAAGLLALNGFMVGFSRIVQYQALVVWMSGLALLCAWEWRTGRDPHTHRWAGLTGAFLGAGLLAHYDAILVAPAITYLGWTALRQPSARNLQFSALRSLLIAACCLLAVAGLFYLPYALDPQAARTGEYLGSRIGDTLLKNNLDSFLHYNVFYSSSYYVILTGLLLVGFLAWALHRAPAIQHAPWGRYWAPALAVVASLGLMLRPDILRIGNLDVAVLPFALIMLSAFLSPALDPGQRSVVAWFAVPFLGYNFAVARPLTHIYTTIPAWTLLAGLAGARMWGLIQSQVSKEHPIQNDKPKPPTHRALLLGTCALLLSVLFGGYLTIAYIRHDPELWQDWPDSRPSLYWSPYDDMPPAGFFGFVHRTGWKEIGALYAEGLLRGDYGSNEEPDVTTWYTRGAPRACDSQPEYYFVADDLVDPWPVDLERIELNYTDIGRVILPNGKGLTMYQAQPSTIDLGHLQTGALARTFDRTATPTAFSRSARGSQPIGANLGGLARLIGFDIDTRRAWPDGRVSIILYWQAQAPISEDYHVFVHLGGDEEAGSTPGVWGQADGRPVCWTYPTFDWRPGQIIADQHAVTVKPDTPPGSYPILVGMYLPETGVRLDVLDEAGKPFANFVNLTTVPIQ